MNSLLSIFLLLVALPLSSVMGQVPADPIIDPPILITDPPVVDPPIDGGDAWLDTDGDSMTDDWERANGLDSEDPADADLDGDGDGLTNLQEFAFGSDPNAADSDGGGASDYAEWVLSTAIGHALDALAVLIYQSPGSTGGSGDFIGSGSMELSTIHRPLHPIDPDVTDPESENEDVPDPVLGEDETTDPGQDEASPNFGAARVAAAPNADDDTGDEILIDDSIVEPVVVIDPTKVLDLLSELMGSFDPNDDADDVAVTAAVARLKELKLWQTVQDIASNKIDLTGLLWASFGTPPSVYSMGATGGPLPGMEGLDGSTSTDAGSTSTPLDSLPDTTPKAYNFGGGSSSADVPSPPLNAAGSNGAVSTGGASSGGSGGGGSSVGAGSSGGHGSPHSAPITSAPAVHSVRSISGTSGSQIVATGSHSNDGADERHHHHHDFGGGSTSVSAGSSSNHVAATVIASVTNPATSGGSSTKTGVALMGLVSAAGWALRRFLTAAI